MLTARAAPYFVRLLRFCQAFLGCNRQCAASIILTMSQLPKQAGNLPIFSPRQFSCIRSGDQTGAVIPVYVMTDIKNTYQNLLRVGICGLRCSPYVRTVALLRHNSLPLATVLLGILKDFSYSMKRDNKTHFFDCMSRQANF